MNRTIRKPRMSRRGATLLDVAIGSMLLAILLIPSVHLIGEARSSHRRLDNREIIVFEAEQLMEETKIALSEPADFDAAHTTPIDIVDSIAVSDGPDLTRRLRVAADPAVPGNQLVTIMVEVWRDLNGDSVLDTDEPSQSLRTQWAAP